MTLVGNPLVIGGWTTIVNSYCSGDLFLGNAEHELIGFNSKVSETVTVYYNGFNNTMSVLNWIKAMPEFPPEQEIVLGGFSAGSLGVQMWANYIVKNYGIDKLLLDSYIGFLPQEAGATLRYWNSCYCAEELGLSQIFIEQCYKGFLYEPRSVFLDFLKRNKNFPVSYTGSTHDAVQLKFYALLKPHEYSGDIIGTFSNFQWATLNSYNEADENFSEYIVDSSIHCFVYKNDISNNPNFNSPYSNQTMLEYISNFLNKDVFNGTPNYPAPTIVEDAENEEEMLNETSSQSSFVDDVKGENNRKNKSSMLFFVIICVVGLTTIPLIHFIIRKQEHEYNGAGVTSDDLRFTKIEVGQIT